MAAYWLVKSEPDSFSWAQQVAAGVEPWTGIRNALARRHLADMRLGDRALFYHSGQGRGGRGRECVGLVEVAREAYPDPTDETGRGWLCVDMRALRPLPRPVTLAQLKADPFFAGLALLRHSRLSVSPVAEPHWRRILAMGGL
jgi:predicted RNA-binding protein with PUA-like domain